MIKSSEEQITNLKQSAPWRDICKYAQSQIESLQEDIVRLGGTQFDPNQLNLEIGAIRIWREVLGLPDLLIDTKRLEQTTEEDTENG